MGRKDECHVRMSIAVTRVDRVSTACCSVRDDAETLASRDASNQARRIPGLESQHCRDCQIRRAATNDWLLSRSYCTGADSVDACKIWPLPAYIPS